MIIPVRCFSCNKVIANKYEKYLEMCKKEDNLEDNKEKIFQKLKLKRYCCRRMLLTHVSLIEIIKN